MNCIIKEIAIFDKEGEKRGVILENGLNIINGDSQSGKSALLEITDYCLLSPRSTIPHGKIMDFADLFVLVLQIDNEFLVIGRHSPRTGNLNKVYFNVDTSLNEIYDGTNLSENKIQGLEKSYFDNINLVSKEIIKKEIGRYFNFDVEDTTINSELSSKKGNASFRNVTPYLFQHQGLVASKHALFYRFEDRNTRERIIDEFPIFMGWVGGEYYLLNREVNEKRTKLRRLERDRNEINKNRIELINKVKNFIHDYYGVIGKNCPLLKSPSDILFVANNLPEFSDESYILSQYEEKKDELRKKRTELVEQKSKIKEEILLLESTSQNIDDYELKFVQLEKRSSEDIAIANEYKCPVCNKRASDISEKLNQIQISRKRMKNDIKKLNKYYIDNSSAIEKLKLKRDEINKSIIDINAEIKLLDNSLKKGKDKSDLKEKSIEIKNLIQLSTELRFGKSNLLFSDGDINKLKAEIKQIEQKMGNYDIDSHRAKFDTDVKKDMNKICSKLDFEDELKPPNLCFESNSFEFYHEIDSFNKVFLSQMGSGANWLSCHLSLFLALHKQFAQRKNCKIPSFIFFDQPSQVYFPKEFNPKKDQDVKNVANIYDVIIDVLNEIENQSGFKIQIIVTDHADNLELKNGNFKDLNKYSWFYGNKLI